MVDTPTIRRFQAADLELVADAAGDPAGQPVIFLHGGGQTRASWGTAVARVAEAGLYAITLDSRGHGDSGWAPDGDYSLDRFADDLDLVLHDIGRPAFVVGASLGGLTALQVAGERPLSPIRGIVLVDVAPQIESAGAERIKGFMQAAPEGFASVEDAAEAVAAYLPHRPKPRDTQGLRKNLRLGVDGRYRWHWDPNLLSTSKPPDPRLIGTRLEAAARRLRIPTLLVRGGLSDVVSPEGARWFLALAPHAEFVDVKGASHMVAGDRNDAFNAAILDFLGRHAALPEPG